MTPKEQKTVMITMVSLIVLLVMSFSYIWYSETNKPLFGKNASKNNDINELEIELSKARSIIDSLVKLQDTVPTFELRRQPPDSLLCITCPYVENINGKYYELLGTFHSAEEARFLASQLLKNGIQAIRIFHRNGLQAEELLLYDSLSLSKK
jgi:hypothetical protein